MEIPCEIGVDVRSKIVAAILEVVDVAFLPKIADRGKKSCVLIPSLGSHAVFLREARPEDLLDVVNIVPAISRVPVRHGFYVFLRESRDVFISAGNSPSCKLVHHIRHIIVISELRAIHEFREVCVHRRSILTIVRYLRVSGFAALRGDDNYAPSALQTVNSCRSTILQHGNAFDVIRIDVVDVGDRITIYYVRHTVDGASDSQ